VYSAPLYFFLTLFHRVILPRWAGLPITNNHTAPYPINVLFFHRTTSLPHHTSSLRLRPLSFLAFGWYIETPLVCTGVIADIVGDGDFFAFHFCTSWATTQHVPVEARSPLVSSYSYRRSLQLDLEYEIMRGDRVRQEARLTVTDASSCYLSYLPSVVIDVNRAYVLFDRSQLHRAYPTDVLYPTLRRRHDSIYTASAWSYEGGIRLILSTFIISSKPRLQTLHDFYRVDPASVFCHIPIQRASTQSSSSYRFTLITFIQSRHRRVY
jgi:hypothetical protein